MPVYKVLIVDDEAVVRSGIALGVDWAQMGCVVVGEASGGREGLAMALRHRPDLIVADIRMPGMDGIQMLTALRANGCGAKVIMLTAYNDFTYVQSALRLGAADYLLKPFRDQDLAATVARLLRRESAAKAPEPEALPVQRGQNKYVQEAIQYVAAHYGDDDIGITAIAAYLSVSEGYLSHVFKKETSCTVTGYLTRYRIHAAMRLLHDCRCKVYEVARQVGYRDVTYFGSIFKKQTGLSPSEYQNRCAQP